MNFLSLAFWIFSFSHPTPPKPVQTGAEQLHQYLAEWKNKRVALVVNQTSVVKNTHLVDTLLSLKINVVKIFSPEHGFRGNVPDGENIDSSIDSLTKIPLVSLYGKHKKPTPEDLENVEIVLFDIQDVGVRYYTYISTLQYVMEACAEQKKKLYVLDRPNPHASEVDGPIMEKGCMSFVGLQPIPILYGMTIGELAVLLNEEKWLTNGVACELKIVPLKNYTHQTKVSLPIKPSPNLPNDHAIALFPSLALFEGTVCSIGRGTAFPFECIGHPLLKKYTFQFTPKSIPVASKNPPLQDKLCYGMDLRNAKPKAGIDLSYLLQVYRAFPEKEKFFNAYFEKLAGTKKLKQQIIDGKTEKEIKATWLADLKKFLQLRKKYLLYP